MRSALKLILRASLPVSPIMQASGTLGIAPPTAKHVTSSAAWQEGGPSFNRNTDPSENDSTYSFSSYELDIFTSHDGHVSAISYERFYFAYNLADCNFSSS